MTENWVARLWTVVILLSVVFFEFATVSLDRSQSQEIDILMKRVAALEQRLAIPETGR